MKGYIAAALRRPSWDWSSTSTQEFPPGTSAASETRCPGVSLHIPLVTNNPNHWYELMQLHESQNI